MVREGVLQTPTQVEFNGWLLEQISGGGSTFDKVLSIFQKVVSIIGIVKKIASLVFVVPLGRRREDENEEPSEENEEPTDDEFLIGLNEAISSGTIFDNVYTKSQVDALLNQYNGALSGFVSSSGGTYGAPFVFSSLQNQFTGSITTDSLTMDGNNVTAIKRSSHNNVSNNNKLTTQAYVDEQLANYLSLYEAEQTYQTQADMVNYLTTSDASNTYQPKSAMTVYLTSANASSTYLTKTDAASTYEKKTDLASSVTTNSLTLNNKTVTDITTGGSSNNNKLTTQGYVDGVLGSYLPSSNASSTYLSKTEAAATYLTTSDAASTYQTQSGMNNYLTTSSALSTYQPISGMSNYLLNADAVGQKYSNSDHGERFNDYTYNVASGRYSHAEGSQTAATFMCSHAEGSMTRATALNAHAGGTYTVADQQNQTAIGQFNTTNNTNCLFAVGNGTGEDARSDAFSVYKNGTKINNYYSDGYSDCCWLPLGHFTPFYINGILRLTNNVNNEDVGHYDVACIAYGFQDPDKKITVFKNIRSLETVTVTRNDWVCITSLTYGNQTFNFTTSTETYFNQFFCGTWNIVSNDHTSGTGYPTQHYCYKGYMYYYRGYNNTATINDVTFKPYFFNENGTGWGWEQNSTPYIINISDLFIKSHSSYFNIIGNYSY